MNRFYLVLFCLALSSCGGSSVSKPTLLWNAENYTDDAMQAYMDKDWARARQLFNHALSLYQGIDDRLGALTSHINLVEVALAVHDGQSAHRHLSLADDIVKIDALKSYQPRLTLLYALVAMQQKQMTEAERLLQTLLPEFDGVELVTIPDAIQIAVIACRTEIAFVQKLDESLWTLRYANALKISANKNTDREARLLRFQAKLLLQQGDYEESEVYLQQALSIYKKNLSLSSLAMTLLEIGQLYEVQSRWQVAWGYLNRSAAVFHFIANAEKVSLVTEKLTKMKAEIAKLEGKQVLLNSGE
ncbi:MAG: tetratricopeptide repeat protein [Methylococcales bacterium]|nr:tetratricopeptide repeat protein [Methylococcales bacterium]